MLALFFAFATALLLALLLTYRARSWGVALEILDHPDGYRKTHPAPVPRIGGVGIYLASLLTAMAAFLFIAEPLWPEFELLRELVVLGAGGTAIFLVGLWDDIHRLSVRVKLPLEAAVALLVFLAGVRIEYLTFGREYALAFPFGLSLLLTVLWLVGIANAFNLLDGSDGVAGGAALFALSTMAGVSFLSGNGLSAGICVVLAGATLGFLFYNFPPASIFLGDSGSLFLGFMLAGTAVVTTQKAPTLVAVAVPLVAFGVPIMDTALAVVRRVIKKKNLFHPDRSHIHHRLRDQGHSARSIALMLYAVCGLFSLMSLVLVGGSARMVGVVLVLAGVVAILTVQRLRMPELLELGKMVHLGKLHATVADRNRRFKEGAGRLREARTGAEILEALDFVFSNGESLEVELWLNPRVGPAIRGLPRVRSVPDGILWEGSFGHEPLGKNAGWEIRLPLTDDRGRTVGRLSVFRPLGGLWLPSNVNLLTQELFPELYRALARAPEMPQDPRQPGSGELLEVGAGPDRTGHGGG